MKILGYISVFNAILSFTSAFVVRYIMFNIINNVLPKT